MPDSPTSNHTTSESHESAIDWLRRIADSYVNELFDQYQPNPPRESRDGKVIRDPIHGFIHLSDLETAVLDSPLVQRLRYIHQNGFAYLVYPSAQHTRLDHSIGVMKVVDDVATSLRNDQCRKNQSSDKAELDDRDLTELRLAALLHDTGHGFLSHMSEELIERHWYDKFAAIRSADARFSGSGAAELLSYFLITSHGFKSYLTEASNRLRKDISVDRIAGYIIGAGSKYKANLITGPLDCDKLDYIARDAYFSGIRLEVDFQYIIHNLCIEKVGDDGSPDEGDYQLVTKFPGLSFVEQMHFARFLMFPAMYYHQKVRALQAQVHVILDHIWSDSTSSKPGLANGGLDFGEITDFLRLSDVEFIARLKDAHDTNLREWGRALWRRQTYRRALQISRGTVVEKTLGEGYSDLVKLSAREPEEYEELVRLRQSIAEKASRYVAEDLSIEDVWIDLPEDLKSGGLTRCHVRLHDGVVKPLYDLFPMANLLDTYGEHKWTGHVFCAPRKGVPRAVNRAAREVFQDEFKIEFEDHGTTNCKLQI